MIAVMMSAAPAKAVLTKQRNNFHKQNTSRVKYTRGVFLLYYKRRKRRFVRLKRFLLALTALSIACVIYCEWKLSDFSPEYIRTQAEIQSVSVICDTVENVLDKLNYSYDDIAKVRYSDSGAVQAIETDSVKINHLKAEISRDVQQEIGKIHDNEIKIPLGIFTNVTSLSNFGPHITMSFSLTGSFNCEIVSTFESIDINQSIHHIRLMLTSKIMTTSLDYSGDITFITDFEIAQTVIVGGLPNYYGALYPAY